MKIEAGLNKLILKTETYFELGFMQALTGIKDLGDKALLSVSLAPEEGLSFYIENEVIEKSVVTLNKTGIPHPVTRSKSSYHKWGAEDEEILKREYPKNTTLASIRKMLNQGVKGRFSHSAIAAKARSLDIKRTRSRTSIIKAELESPRMDPPREVKKHPYVKWSKEDSETLRELWDKNLYIDVIRERFGNKYTRDGIYGKANRMELPIRPHVTEMEGQMSLEEEKQSEKESITV